MAQTRAVGAELRAVEGSFDEAMRNCVTIAEEGKYVLVNSLNPNRIEGQKTAVFEIVEQLGGRAPDILALPYGGGGNTVAYAKGFQEEGIQPRMISAHAVERGTTMASAIRIAEPVHIHEVEALVAEGRVEPVAVADEDITRMWLELAKLEGIFCEPSSAAGLAAIAQLDLQPGATVVCVLTGHGLKDTAAVELHTPEAVPVEPTKDSILSGVSTLSAGGFVIRAPASTANLGPGFDCAAAALDLWNELHVLPAADGEPLVTLEGVGAGELPTDASHLALRAFALAAPIKGHRFHFVNRIPLERGLGSSAATVAAGITAGPRGRRARRSRSTRCSSSRSRSRATPTTSPRRSRAASA